MDKYPIYYADIPLDSIIPLPVNDELFGNEFDLDSLVQSITTVGVIQDIVVESKTRICIEGNKRLQALHTLRDKLNITTIRVKMIDLGGSAEDVIKMALDANLIRRHLPEKQIHEIKSKASSEQIVDHYRQKLLSQLDLGDNEKVLEQLRQLAVRLNVNIDACIADLLKRNPYTLYLVQSADELDPVVQEEEFNVCKTHDQIAAERESLEEEIAQKQDELQQLEQEIAAKKDAMAASVNEDEKRALLQTIQDLEDQIRQQKKMHQELSAQKDELLRRERQLKQQLDTIMEKYEAEKRHQEEQLALLQKMRQEEEVRREEERAKAQAEIEKLQRQLEEMEKKGPVDVQEFIEEHTDEISRLLNNQHLEKIARVAAYDKQVSDLNISLTNCKADLIAIVKDFSRSGGAERHLARALLKNWLDRFTITLQGMQGMLNGISDLLNGLKNALGDNDTQKNNKNKKDKDKKQNYNNHAIYQKLNRFRDLRNHIGRQLIEIGFPEDVVEPQRTQNSQTLTEIYKECLTQLKHQEKRKEMARNLMIPLEETDVIVARLEEQYKELMDLRGFAMEYWRTFAEEEANRYLSRYADGHVPKLFATDKEQQKRDDDFLNPLEELDSGGQLECLTLLALEQALDRAQSFAEDTFKKQLSQRIKSKFKSYFETTKQWRRVLVLGDDEFVNEVREDLYNTDALITSCSTIEQLKKYISQNALPVKHTKMIVVQGLHNDWDERVWAILNKKFDAVKILISSEMLEVPDNDNIALCIKDGTDILTKPGIDLAYLLDIIYYKKEDDTLNALKQEGLEKCNLDRVLTPTEGVDKTYIKQIQYNMKYLDEEYIQSKLDEFYPGKIDVHETILSQLRYINNELSKGKKNPTRLLANARDYVDFVNFLNMIDDGGEDE